MVSKSLTGPRLVIIEGKDKGKVIELRNGTAVIGRSKGDVLIHDPRISRSHVAIHFEERSGKVTYTDLKSLNGTLINGDTHETGELHDGDRLMLGNTLLDCQILPMPAEITEGPESRVKKKGKESIREPQLAILDEHDDERDGEQIPEEPIFNDTNTNIPAEPALAHANEITSAMRLSPFKRFYLSFPRKTRVYALCGMALVLSIVYSTLGGKGGGPSQSRGIASIKKLESEGKLGEAVAAAEAFRLAEPKNLEIHLVLGDLYMEQAKPDLALASYTKAQEIDPSFGPSFVKLARFHVIQGHLKEAEMANQQIDRLLIEGPQSKEFFVEVANLYLDFRELDVPPQKMIIIGQALQNKFAPGETIGLKLEGVGLILQNYAEQAFPVLEKARNIDSNDQSILQYEVVAKLRLKDYAGATTILQNWSNQFPLATRPLLVLAQLKFDAGDPQGALVLLQRLLQMTAKNPQDPVLPEALSVTGKVYARLNQPQEAEAALKESCNMGYPPGCDMLKQLTGSGNPAQPGIAGAPSNNQKPK